MLHFKFCKHSLLYSNGQQYLVTENLVLLLLSESLCVHFAILFGSSCACVSNPISFKESVLSPSSFVCLFVHSSFGGHGPLLFHSLDLYIFSDSQFPNVLGEVIRETLCFGPILFVRSLACLCIYLFYLSNSAEMSWRWRRRGRRRRGRIHSFTDCQFITNTHSSSQFWLGLHFLNWFAWTFWFSMFTLCRFSSSNP